MGAKLKFPRPSDYPAKEPAIMCPAVRVIGLFNQDSGDSAKRIAKKVRKWFTSEATNRGWAGVHFLKEVQSSHGAGCVLWRPPDQVDVQITVTNHVLVLFSEGDDDQ